MRAVNLKSRLHWLFTAFTLFALAACGGGGGSPGTNNAVKLTTPTDGNAVVLDTFSATLTGAQQTLPTPSLAQGFGTVTVNLDTLRLSAMLTTVGVAGVSAQIQEGIPGTDGPVILPLNETAPGSGTWSASAFIGNALLETFRAGRMYFNVRSAAFPNGEIRGQIVLQQESPANAAGTPIPAPASVAIRIF